MFSQDGQYMEAEDSRPVCGVVCTTLKVVLCAKKIKKSQKVNVKSVKVC